MGAASADTRLLLDIKRDSLCATRRIYSEFKSKFPCFCLFIQTFFLLFDWLNIGRLDNRCVWCAVLDLNDNASQSVVHLNFCSCDIVSSWKLFEQLARKANIRMRTLQDRWSMPVREGISTASRSSRLECALCQLSVLSWESRFAD